MRLATDSVACILSSMPIQFPISDYDISYLIGNFP